MYKTINEYEFRRGFEQLRPGNFSYDSLGELFRYLEELENGIGEELEYDVIGICCDYSELDLEEINNDYRYDEEPFDTLEEAAEWLEEQTTVIPVSNDRIIIQQF